MYLDKFKASTYPIFHGEPVHANSPAFLTVFLHAKLDCSPCKVNLLWGSHVLSYVVICCHMLSLDDLERRFQIHMFAFKNTGQEIKGLSKVSRQSDTGLTSASPTCECSGDLQPKCVHRISQVTKDLSSKLPKPL